MRCSLRDAADSLVARHERIAQAREGRHAPFVQQPFGAGADRAPFDVDGETVRGIRQLQLLQRQLPRPPQHHGDRVHSPTPRRRPLSYGCQVNPLTKSVNINLHSECQLFATITLAIMGMRVRSTRTCEKPAMFSSSRSRAALRGRPCPIARR